ncbi:unnamed protein product [Trichogramma brassicae]|uniref:Large ribosomal subunit protein P2 n=1 Tax=Trichogramma brassicae TaxID=86971 RepID=A0A6H5I9B8_9HYME|nr:unnamed protein product [Trichogramma brassicae]
MRYVAAYLLAVLGGKASPSQNDLEKILSSVGIEADAERLQHVLKSLNGKDIEEVIADGRKMLSSMPVGGAAAPAAAAAGAAAPAAEEKKVCVRRSLSFLVLQIQISPTSPQQFGYFFTGGSRVTGTRRFGLLAEFEKFLDYVVTAILTGYVKMRITGLICVVYVEPVVYFKKIIDDAAHPGPIRITQCRSVTRRRLSVFIDFELVFVAAMDHKFDCLHKVVVTCTDYYYNSLILVAMVCWLRGRNVSCASLSSSLAPARATPPDLPVAIIQMRGAPPSRLFGSLAPATASDIPSSAYRSAAAVHQLSYEI